MMPIRTYSLVPDPVVPAIPPLEFDLSQVPRALIDLFPQLRELTKAGVGEMGFWVLPHKVAFSNLVEARNVMKIAERSPAISSNVKVEFCRSYWRHVENLFQIRADFKVHLDYVSTLSDAQINALQQIHFEVPPNIYMSLTSYTIPPEVAELVLSTASKVALY